jgi:pantetheine-phosphate adenylyltransferase
VVADNPDKHYFIGDGEERAELVRQVLSSALTLDQYKRVKVVVLGKRFLGDYAVEVGATVNLRGLRNSMDFQYEYNMQAVNTDIAPSLTTVYVATDADKAHISSSLVRGFVGIEGWLDRVQKYVHPFVTFQLNIAHERQQRK